MENDNVKYKITWVRIVIYGIVIGIIIGLLESAIGWKFYSATLHGYGYTFGNLNLLPFLLTFIGILFIWKFSGKTRFWKIILFFILNITAGAILVFFPFKF